MVDQALARFLAALDQTQHLDADRMVAYQRRLLDRLLRHARAEVPYQAARLAPLFRSDDSIDWDRWSEIPILMRAEAQELGDRLKARTLPPAAGAPVAATTSGSSGRAFRHYSNVLQNLATACANERFFTWHHLDPMAQAAAIRHVDDPATRYPRGMRMTGWRIAHPGSPMAVLSVSTPVEDQVRWLRGVQPKILSSYPSNVREIGRIAKAMGKPLEIDKVLTVGEMITADMRAEITERFGHAPVDQYGSTEVGHIAGVCPHSGNYHVASDLVRIEIVDDDGTPLPAGRDGRVIATPFYNYAMPFIRYDTGDHGAISDGACACGRTLPLLKRILGRGSDIFRFTDGTRVSPMLIAWEMGRFVPHLQCQMVQTALDRVELRYVPRNAGQESDVAGLTAYVRQNLHPSLTVDVTAVDRIDRLPSGKFADFVGLRDEA